MEKNIVNIYTNLLNLCST